MDSKFIRRATKYVSKWKKLLNLEDWRIDIIEASEKDMYDFLSEEDVDKGEARIATRNSVAATDLSSRYVDNLYHIVYRHARVLIRKDLIEDDNELESTILHELLHIFLSSIAHDIDDKLEEIMLERVIVTLERILIDAYKERKERKQK